MEFRKHQPPIKPIDKVVLPVPEEMMLGKIPVYIFPSDNNILRLKIFFKAGTWYQKKPLQAFFTNKMLCEGTVNFSSEKIAEHIDFYGAKLNFAVDDDWATVTLLVSLKNFGQVLPVLAEMIFQPVFPEKEFKVQKDITFQNFIINNEKVATLARNYFLETLYGNSNYYGYRTKNEDFKNIETETLSAFHKQHYLPENAMIILTGKLGTSEINLLQKYFLVESTTKTQTTSFTLLFKSGDNRKIYIPKKDALQAAIRIGKVLFNRTHPDDMGFRFLNVVLGGYFGSRLMSNIREDKGYTYGIYSSLVSMQQSGYFSVFAEVGAPVFKKATHEIYNEIKRLQDEKIGEDELETVRSYILGNFLRNIDGPLNFSGIFENALLYGYDVNYFNEYLKTVKTMNANTLLGLAQKYLDAESMYEVVVG